MNLPGWLWCIKLPSLYMLAPINKLKKTLLVFIYNHESKSGLSLSQNYNQPTLGEEDVYNHRCISPKCFHSHMSIYHFKGCLEHHEASCLERNVSTVMHSSHHRNIPHSVWRRGFQAKLWHVFFHNRLLLSGFSASHSTAESRPMCATHIGCP